MRRIATNTMLAVWGSIYTIAYTADKGLAGSWRDFWAAISGKSIIPTVMGWIGAAAMVLALIGFFWSKRKGQGNPQLTQGLLWVALFGGILALPGTLLPVMLGLVDGLIRAVANILGKLK